MKPRTPMGKFLAKLRLDRNEKLADMGKNIGTCQSMLSMVEHVQKKMPVGWIKKIALGYSLTDKQAREFMSAFLETYGPNDEEEK